MTQSESDRPVEVLESQTGSSEVESEERPDPAEGLEGEAPGRHRKSVVREYFESIVVTFIMALFAMTFVMMAVKVPTGSMLNTILIEDHLMVNKFQLSSHPSWLESVLPYRDIRRGDIIVFKYPPNPSENYVKRVIGLPGDRVEVRGRQVFVNDELLKENWIKVVQPKVAGTDGIDESTKDLVPDGPVNAVAGASWTVSYFIERRGDDGAGVDESGYLEYDYHGTTDGKFVVPANSYFCLGDNRDNSQDSRFWGSVPRENVIGRAMFVYFSINEHERTMNGPRSLLVDIFKYSRWSRIGTIVR
ncbi:MAG: signal peptidase I [Acidobacteria bacterium]|nr:signal peptidase I [Acidobacteriota bacterium]